MCNDKIRKPGCTCTDERCVYCDIDLQNYNEVKEQLILNGYKDPNIKLINDNAVYFTSKF